MDGDKKNCHGENLPLRIRIVSFGNFIQAKFLSLFCCETRFSKIVWGSCRYRRGSIGSEIKSGGEWILRAWRRWFRSPVATSSHHPVASVGFSATTSIGMTQGKRKRANEPRSALIVTSSQR